MERQRIYFDNAATTRCDPRVVEAMLPYLAGRYGNPASRTHPFGWEAEEGVEQAREEVAALLGAEPAEVVFTSGATESDNLALKGALWAHGLPAHLIVARSEHSAILDPARSLERSGVSVTFLDTDGNGLVHPDALRAAIRPETALVSIMHGNNETGVIQDLESLAGVCREAGVLFHSDAAQSLGKVPLNVRRLGLDLLSCSAHKMYGPKGAGALFVRRRGSRVALSPLLEGGGQERGLRSGTLNVPAIVGFGRACRLAGEEIEREPAAIARLRDRLEETILRDVPWARRNGPAAPRLPGISNLHFRGLSGEALLLALDRVALSSGSACASASLEPSHVLLALGLSEEVSRNSIRFSLGRFNTAEEVLLVIQDVSAAVARLAGGGALGESS